MIAAVVAALTLGGTATAQEGVSALKGHDSRAPIDLSADHAEAQDRADRAIFAGNVVVRQSGLTLRTARLTMAYASNDGIDINRIDASGGVTVTSASETARGNFAIYDLDKGLITMVGDVRLDRGGLQPRRRQTGDRPEHRPRDDGWRASGREPDWRTGHRSLHRLQKRPIGRPRSPL